MAKLQVLLQSVKPAHWMEWHSAALAKLVFVSKTTLGLGLACDFAGYSARLSGGAGCSRLVTTWFGWSENQKNTFKIKKHKKNRQKREMKRKTQI